MAPDPAGGGQGRVAAPNRRVANTILSQAILGAASFMIFVKGADFDFSG